MRTLIQIWSIARKLPANVLDTILAFALAAARGDADGGRRAAERLAHELATDEALRKMGKL